MDIELQDTENIYSEEFWYDLVNGYIDVDKCVKDPEIAQRIKDGVEIISAFEKALDDANCFG